MATIKEPKMRLGAQPDPQYHVQQGSLWRDARTHDELKPVIYEALCQFWDENGYAPSYRELAKMAHVLSLSTVKIITLELEIQGKVRRTNAPMRMLVPVRDGNDES